MISFSWRSRVVVAGATFSCFLSSGFGQPCPKKTRLVGPCRNNFPTCMAHKILVQLKITCYWHCLFLLWFWMKGSETWCGKETGEVGEENTEGHRWAHPLVFPISHSCDLSQNFPDITVTSTSELGVNYQANCFVVSRLQRGLKPSDNMNGAIPPLMCDPHSKNRHELLWRTQSSQMWRFSPQFHVWHWEYR